MIMRSPRNGKKSDFEIFESYLKITKENAHLNTEDLGLVENAPKEAVKAYENFKESMASLKRKGIY